MTTTTILDERGDVALYTFTAYTMRATLAYDSTYVGRIRQGRSHEEAHAEANKAAGRARREVDRELEG